MEAVNFYNPKAAIRAIRNIIPDLSRKMNDKQLEQLAETLILEDADQIKKAFTNAESRNAMLNKLTRLANSIVIGGTQISATQTPSVISPNINFDMKAFATELKPETKEKIRNMNLINLSPVSDKVL